MTALWKPPAMEESPARPTVIPTLAATSAIEAVTLPPVPEAAATSGKRRECMSTSDSMLKEGGARLVFMQK